MERKNNATRDLMWGDLFRDVWEGSSTRPEILEMYLDWYNNHPEATKEDLYKDYYGKDRYMKFFEAGTLDLLLAK